MAAHLNSVAVPTSVLGVAAHPDDLDYMASGTIASWVRAGARAYYLILTNGNKGSADPKAEPAELTRIRRQEQREAARILGVRDVFFCDYEDGELVASLEVKREIVRIIRRVRPQAVITIDPTMLYVPQRQFINHTDHRAAGQAAIDAVFPLARDHLSFPELFQQEGLEPHKVQDLYLVHFGQETCFVDISEVIDIKLLALAAHPTQTGDMRATEKLIRKSAEELGSRAGVPYAEGFVHLPIKT